MSQQQSHCLFCVYFPRSTYYIQKKMEMTDKWFIAKVISATLYVYEYCTYKWSDSWSITTTLTNFIDWAYPWVFIVGARLADFAAWLYQTIRSICHDFVIDQLTIIWRFIVVTYIMTFGLVFEFIDGYSSTIKEFYMGYAFYVNVTTLVCVLLSLWLVARNTTWTGRLWEAIFTRMASLVSRYDELVKVYEDRKYKGVLPACRACMGAYHEEIRNEHEAAVDKLDEEYEEKADKLYKTYVLKEDTCSVCQKKNKEETEEKASN